MKTCSKCKEAKELGQFYKRADRDSYHSWCKSCKHLSGKQWSMKNKERHSHINSEWYEQNKEKHLANSRQWYKDNKHRKLETTTAREKRCVLATPTWADRELIKELYALAQKLTAQTGIPHEVDHVIPLQGKTVSGFHVENNLQVIPATENRRKSNKFNNHTPSGF
jgi:hypothetical protein